MLLFLPFLALALPFRYPNSHHYYYITFQQQNQTHNFYKTATRLTLSRSISNHTSHQNLTQPHALLLTHFPSLPTLNSLFFYPYFYPLLHPDNQVDSYAPLDVWEMVRVSRFCIECLLWDRQMVRIYIWWLRLVLFMTFEMFDKTCNNGE